MEDKTREEPRGAEARQRAIDEARCAGWADAVREFAVWRDGQQLVGCMERPLNEALERGPSGASPGTKVAFDRLQEVRHEG